MKLRKWRKLTQTKISCCLFISALYLINMLLTFIRYMVKILFSLTLEQAEFIENYASDHQLSQSDVIRIIIGKIMKNDEEIIR
jgi:hypothetical protein